MARDRRRLPSRRPRTIVTHWGDDPARFHGAVTPPIYETSTFAMPSYDAMQASYAGDDTYYRYTRGRNPTTEIVEAKLAALEDGEACLCFGAGMGAVAATLLTFLRAGGHVVAVQNVYGDTYRFLEELGPRFGVERSYVRGASPDEVEAALRPETQLVWLESPTSLLFELQDLRAISARCRARGIPTVTDNSWATPCFQQPLALGADLAVHSATKYLGGHSDIVAGAVIGTRDLLTRIRRTEASVLGSVLGPFEAWLLLRGLRTLPVRMEAHQQAGLQVAQHLAGHPRVRRVNHPGLPSHPQHALGLAQMRGYSGLFSIELDTDVAGVRRFCDALEMFYLGVSWGGWESLAFPAGAGSPTKRQAAADTLVRLSVGLEDAEDLIADLDQALAAAG
jgi:cystathionine beta-lyase